MLLVGVALPLSSPTYTVSHTGIRHGAADPASPFQISSAWTSAQLAAEIDGLEA